MVYIGTKGRMSLPQVFSCRQLARSYDPRRYIRLMNTFIRGCKPSPLTLLLRRWEAGFPAPEKRDREAVSFPDERIHRADERPGVQRVANRQQTSHTPTSPPVAGLANVPALWCGSCHNTKG